MAASLPAFDVVHIKASQYVSAVGLTIMLWDHALTFADEVELIWKARLSMPKVLFLFNRYFIPIAMIVETHLFSSAASYIPSMFCKLWTTIAVAVGMLSIATSNFLVLLRLWVLWDRSPRLVLSTLTFYAVTQVVSIGFAIYVIYDMFPTLAFEPLLRICAPTEKPKFILLWAPSIAFEVMIFLTTVWNALDRPRSHNLEMARIMYRDGSVYFLGLFVLRLVNMLISLLAPLSLIFLGIFFLWSVSNITLSHLIFNLRRLSNNKSRVVRNDDDDELGRPSTIGETEDGLEHTELTVLHRVRSSSSEPHSKVVL